MEMMNRAIEGASDFSAFMQKIQQRTDRFKDEVQHQLETGPGDSAEQCLGSDRQPGENREMHRARLKAERRSVASQKAQR